MKKFHISNLKFQIESAICAICVICGLQSAAGLEISHTAVSNVTRISADYSGAVTATNGTGTNPVVTIYWGTSDGGSNAANWANSVALSNVEVGAFGTNLADLTPAQYYYINISANEGTDTVWAAASTSWWTLAGAPTSSYPAATGGVFLVVGTNGEFLAPAKSNIISANGLADTNITAALQGQITSNSGAITTNAQAIGSISTRVDNAEGAITTNAQDFASHSNDTANPHGVTPTQIGALAASSNLLDVADTNAARANLGAAAQADLDQVISQTNQVIVVDGTAYIITNAPAAAGDVLVFDPASTTACFAAQSGGGITLADVKNVAPLMTNSDNIIMGKSASGNNYGVALGSTAVAPSFGTAVGQGANGGTYGAAIGANANGGTYGAAIGSFSIGVSYGAAIGRAANGQNYSLSVGAYSYAISNSAALGAYVTNPVPGTTRVRGDLYLDGGTKIYTRAAFNSGEFSELAASGGAAGTYPVFAIPLGGAWTDFEIKASTNNFTDLCYYYKSWTNTQDATRGDTNALVYFTDDHAGDVRVWNLKPQTSAISEMLTSTNSEVETVYFYPSHDCTIPWGDWMSITNTALVWSFVRVDDLVFEMNASGTYQHWSPIRPDSWEIERTMP